MRRLFRTRQGGKRTGRIAAGVAVIAALASCGPGNMQRHQAAPAVTVPAAGPSALNQTDEGTEGKAKTPFMLDVRTDEVPERYCAAFPEIEHFSDARGLDPLLVRALIIDESGFDPCAAARVCAQGITQPGPDGRSCRDASAMQDEGYSQGYDEMYDPDRRCRISNAFRVQGSPPEWRWVGLGLMQSIEPPYTFWPAPYNPGGKDGPYANVFHSSGLGSHHTSENFGHAGECAPETTPKWQFNPFNPRHSVCLGTSKLEYAMKIANMELVEMHQDGQLNWSDNDTEKDNAFAAYIATHLYTGTWGMPSSSMSGFGGDNPCNIGGEHMGSCLVRNFKYSWEADERYCGSDKGKDDDRCKDGKPRREPPGFCFGYKDIIEFANDCITPFMPLKVDLGKKALETYYWLKDGCGKKGQD